MVPLTLIFLHVFEDKESKYYDDDNQSHNNEATSNTSKNHSKGGRRGRGRIYRDRKINIMSTEQKLLYVTN